MLNIKHRIISLVLTTLAITNRVSTPLKLTNADNIISTVQIMIKKLKISLPLTELKHLPSSALNKLLKESIDVAIKTECKENINKDLKNKLRTYCQFKTNFEYEPYINHVKIKSHRTLLTKFRTGTLKLMIEKGRLKGLEEKD